MMLVASMTDVADVFVSLSLSVCFSFALNWLEERQAGTEAGWPNGVVNINLPVGEDDAAPSFIHSLKQATNYADLLIK